MAMKFKHGSELLNTMTKDGGSEGRKPVISRGAGKPDLPALSQQTTGGEVSASPAVAASAYYKRPDFGSRSQKLYDDAMTAESSMKEKQTAWESASTNLTRAEDDLVAWSQHLQIVRELYAEAPTPENGELVSWTEGEMDRVLMDFAKVQESYDSAYSGYETQYQQYAAAVDAYNSYIQDQQTQYDAWKGTIRDEETIRGDIEAVEAQMNSLRRSGTGGRWNDASLTQMQSLTDAKALLEEELSWSQYFHYAGFAEASVFKEKSQYVSTANDVKRSAGEIMMGIYTDAGSGWDDPLYEYINGNQEAGIYISNQAATKYGVGNAIGEAFGRLTESRSEARQMTENEIATFNYIYATEGKEAAHQYYNYLLADLNYRQRLADEESWGQYAADNKLGASVLSVAMSPAKGLSYLGQAVDYLEDGKIDQNAAYNKISYIPSTIRAKVSENWGAVGSFAYQTGMSMADFLLNTAITGGSEAASLAIMGTGAAADATISAKDRGLSDDQAFALGTIAGIAEVIDEDIQSFIETGLESEPGTASHKLAEEMQKKLEAGKKLSGTDLSRLYQANVQAVAEEQEAEVTKERNLNSTTGLEWAGSEPATETEKEAQSQTAGNVEGKERNGDSVNISVAEQLRREAAEQGGNIHESETGLRLGAAFEQPEAGNNVPDGGGQRAAGAGTGKQAGTVAAGTEGSRQQAEADRRRATVARQNRAGHLQKVSSLDLGITTGTEEKNIRVMPREIWDEEMTGLADRIYEETGKDVTFVVGRIQIHGAGGTGYVRGVNTGEQIIVQVDNAKAHMEQIADHEAYHAKVDFAGNARLNDRIREHILERFSEEEFTAVLDKYIAALRGIYNLDEAKNEAEYDAMMRRIEEELFADAYAGINAFGAGADQFTGAVNEKMTELYLGKQTRQENGTRQTNGPNGERYSYAGENARTANLQTLEEARELQRQGVANETIRQQTGWFRGMDGKWRFEVDDSSTQVSENPYTYTTLGELLKGAEILKAYPNLEDVSVVFQSLKPGINASYNPQFDEIDVSYKLKGDPEAVRAAVLHEIQHAVQRWEGFTKGTSVESWERKIRDGFDSRRGEDIRKAAETERAIREVQQTEPEFYRDMMELDAMTPDGHRGEVDWDTLEQITEDPPEWQAFDARRDALEAQYGDLKVWDFMDLLYQREKAAKAKGRTGTELYWDTAGEIEARDVAGRRNLTAEQRKKTPPISGGEDTVFAESSGIELSMSIAEYPYSMQTVLREYVSAVDHTVVDFVQEVKNGTAWKGKKISVGSVSGKMADDIYKNTGVRNTEGATIFLNTNAVEHIEKRHGKYGEHDHSLGNVQDIARIGYILENYDEILPGNNLSGEYKNRNGSRAQTIVVSKKINGTYFVVEAVPDTGKIGVISAYINKKGASQVPDENTPSRDVRNALVSTPDESVAQTGWKVNGRDLEDDVRYSVDEEAQQKQADGAKKVKPVAESRPITAKRQLKSTLYNMFSIPAGERTELGEMIDSYADRLIKNRSLTEEDRKAFFDRMYESGVMTVPANPYYAEARSYLKEGRIYISDSLVADLGDDWNETRRRAFAAGIYLTRSREQNGHSSMGIDVWNADLAEELPGLFDSEETDERSILERIIQVAEEGKDEKLSLAEYTARLADKDYVSEDEFLNNMERQLDWALRTFAEKADLEINLRDRTGRKIAEERAKGNERLTRQRAREIQRQAEERQARREAAQRAKERRELRELQQKTLKQLRWLNKNRNRAPEELRDAWDEVLGDIDLYAVSAANEMNWSEKHSATWRDLAQMYKDAQENDPNFLPSKELEKIVGRLNSDKIGDMDPGALQDLYKAAIGLRTEFYNRNNVVNDEMHRLFAEVYTDSKKEIESAPGGYTGNRVDQLFNLDQLTPMNVLQRMGGWDPEGTFYSMAKQLEKGERDMRAYTVKANRILADFLTDNADWVSKCDGQGKDGIWYEKEIPTLLALEVGKPPVFGATVKVWMTPAQKVHLYLESKNQDNLRHMTGGRTFVNKDLYSQGKRQEALSQGTTIRMAPETVKLLVSDLTAEEMELASLLDRYYNSYATGEINRVSNILYGYDKAMGSHYAPIYTNRNYTKSEFGVFDVTAEGVGNLKERQVSKNPSYNISALDAFERHMDQTARFVGMAIPARNWTNLMNWREKNNSAGDVITHKWGEVGKKYITDLITTLQSGGENQTDSVSEGANKLVSNYITAVFGANPSIVLKQLGSIPMAGAYLDMRNFPTIAQIRSIDRELIAKYTQDLEWRTMGYSMPETKYLKDNPNWTKKNKVFGFIFGGDAITAMDGWAASVLWPWAENKVSREHRELDAGSEAFYKKVAEEFEDALARSQSTSDEIHQSSLRKSKNPVTKAFTMFRSDSAQTYNTIRQKIGELQFCTRNGENEAAVKHAKKAVGAAFGALLLNAVWSEAVSFLMALWKNKGKNYRDDEEELTAASVIGEMTVNMVYSMLGTVTFGEEIAEAIGSWITGGKWYDIEAPGLEQINEVVSVIGDAAGGLKDLISGASDIVKNDGDLGKYFRQHSGDILGHIKETAQTAATYFTGLSVNNVEAYLLGAVKWISPELGTAYDELFQSVGKNDLAGMTGDSLHGRIGRILDRRRISESDETAEALGQLYEAGFKGAVPGDTPSSISINGEQQKLSVYQQQAYDTIWSGTVGGLLDELVASDKFAGADAQIQEKMLLALYDYASEMAKSELFDDYEPSGSAIKLYLAMNEGVGIGEYLSVKTSGANVNDLMELIGAGADPEDAAELVEGINKLQPEEGKDQVADAQKWRECVDRSSNHMVQMSFLSAYMTEEQYGKLDTAYTFDVDPEVFVAYYEVRAEYDTNGNGSYSNAEVQAAIDSMTGYQLTAEQKAVLWQLMTGSKSAKNNPYSTSEGQSLLDYLETE